MECIKYASDIESKKNDNNEQKRLLDISIVEIELTLDLTRNKILSSFHTFTMMHLFNYFIEHLNTKSKNEDSVSKKIKKILRSDESQWQFKKLERIEKQLRNIQTKYNHQIGIY